MLALGQLLQCALAVLVLAGCFIGSPASAAETYQADPALVAAATKEGEVVWYSTLIINQIIRPMIEAFNRQFPQIKVSYVRGDSPQVLLWLLDEARAHRVRSDVWNLASGFEKLRAAGAAAKLDVPNAKALPPECLDPDGYWVATDMTVHVLAYNTTMVADSAVPRSHADLLDPRWRGKMAWKVDDMTGSTGFIGAVLNAMGEQRGMDFLRALAGQQLIPVVGSVRAMLDQVIAGEYPIGLQASNHHVAISAAHGAPVAWTPLDLASASLQLTGISTNAPHPHAAQLFVDFAISQVGEEVYRNAGYIPTRLDTPALVPKLKPGQGSFAAHVFQPAEIDANYARWSKIYDELFK
jgi:ABC-type Fe3+ transport system substrate-binding protein